MSHSETLKRFLKHVDKSADGCWHWIGSKNRKGYGHFLWHGVGPMAHRCAWTLLRGPIPEKLQVDHLCKVRSCVNPDHMELVTLQENVRRSDVGLHQRQKTHCPRGHEYAGRNLYVNRKAQRICRTCNAMSQKHYRGVPESEIAARYKNELRIAKV